MTPDISIVIPVRHGGSPQVTLCSLELQTYRHFDTIVVHDHESRGAPWARNQGMKQVTTPLVLFSDDDVEWTPWALDKMRTALIYNPGASYSYGGFYVGSRLTPDREFNREELRGKNFVTTMSLVRWAHHPGWDESLKRLQDWDVWLTMLERGYVGVSCGAVLFSTQRRNGITYGGITYGEAERVVMAKHGLLDEKKEGAHNG